MSCRVCHSRLHNFVSRIPNGNPKFSLATENPAKPGSVFDGIVTFDSCIGLNFQSAVMIVHGEETRSAASLWKAEVLRTPSTHLISLLKLSLLFSMCFFAFVRSSRFVFLYVFLM